MSYSSDDEEGSLMLSDAGEVEGVVEGDSSDRDERIKITMRLQKSALTRGPTARAITPTDVPLQFYQVRITDTRRVHMDVAQKGGVDDAMAPGYDAVSIRYPEQCYGFRLLDVVEACTTTKQKKGKGSSALVRQSQLTINPIKAWGIPGCIFYLTISDGDYDPTIPDLGIEHDLESDNNDGGEGEEEENEDATAKKKARKHKKNSELVTTNQQRMRRVRHRSLTNLVLPLQNVPLFFSKQSNIMMRINNPLTICALLFGRLQQALPEHREDPLFVHQVLQFQKNFYFISHDFVIRASLTDELAEKMLAADGFLRRQEEAAARIEAREKAFAKLLDGYSEVLAADKGAKALALKRKRSQVLAQVAREERQAHEGEGASILPIGQVKDLVIGYLDERSQQKKADAEQLLMMSDDEEEGDGRRPPPREEGEEEEPPAKRPRLLPAAAAKGKKKQQHHPTAQLDLSDDE